MKKLFSVLAVLFVLGTVNVFALGIGPQGGYTVNGSPSGALTFKVDSLPCVFAVSAELGKVTAVGVTADWWIANPTIEGTWGYFYGVGLGGKMYMGDGWSYLNIGPRAVLGTNVRLLNNFLELYVQAVYQPTFNINLSGESGQAGFNWAGFGAAGGFRIWL